MRQLHPALPEPAPAVPEPQHGSCSLVRQHQVVAPGHDFGTLSLTATIGGITSGVPMVTSPASASPSRKRAAASSVVLLLLGVAAACGTDPSTGRPSEAITQQYTPHSGEYEHIALPVHAPPAGALLESSS